MNEVFLNTLIQQNNIILLSVVVAILQNSPLNLSMYQFLSF